MTEERPAGETDERDEVPEPAHHPEPAQEPMEDEVGGDEIEAAAIPRHVGMDGARGRRVLAAVFWLLASISVLLGGVALWAHQTLLTEDGWGGLMAEVIGQDEVTDALSVVVVDRLADSLGVDQLVADALPGPDIIAGAITSTVQGRITDRVADLAQGDAFQQAFVNVNKVAHATAMRAIRGGDSEALTAEQGVIAINVFPLIEGLLRSLQDAGVIRESREIPDLTDFQASPQMIGLVENVLGRDIPDDVGTIVLIESDRLDVVQTVVRWFDAITIVLLLLWAGFTALALWLSRTRVRMVLWLSGGAIAALLAGRFVTRLVLEAVTRRQPELEARVVVSAVIDAAVDSLMWFTFVLMLVAVIVAIVAVVYERRDRVGRISLETPPRTLARWVHDHVGLVLGIGLGVIGVVVLWSIGGPEIAMLVTAAVLLLVFAIKIVSDQADEPGSAEG